MILNISIGLSEESCTEAVKILEDYQNNLMTRVENFTKQLAEVGVDTAKLQVVSFPAFDTGALYESINLKKGDILTDSVTYYVYTDCEYAPFVEFGTGIVAETEGRHPNPQAITVGGKTYDSYDSQGHGWEGWVYNKDGWHWTAGQKAKPFMYNTAIFLATRVSEIAKECF